MNKDSLEKINTIFPIGEELTEQFSKYFIGTAYLNMLTTSGVGIGNNWSFGRRCIK